MPKMMTMTIDAGATVVQRRELISGSIDGETILMSVENGVYYGMDEVGTLIWQLLEQPMPVRDLCNTLTSEFEIDFETCEQDTLTFLTDLAGERLIDVL